MAKMKIGEIKLSNNNEIILTGEIRIQIWATSFGVVQDLLRVMKPSSISLDLTKLTWIDPLPALSLIMSIMEAETHQTHIKLPDLKQKAHRAAIAFLKLEGFFDLIPDPTFHLSNTNNSFNWGDHMETLMESLMYPETRLIKAHIFNFDENYSESQIVELSNHIMTQARPVIKNRIESSKSEEIFSKLGVLVSETLLNIHEHAYPINPNKSTSNFKLAGIYIRFRFGLGNTKFTPEDYNNQKKLISAETKGSPKLSRFFIEQLFSFIEVFIIDNGVGITETFSPTRNSHKKSFRNAWEQVVHLGDRGQNPKNKKTQFGGLHLVYKSLGVNYIWAMEKDEIIGHETPTQERHFYEKLQLTDSEKHIKGLSFIYRLKWEQESDFDKSWKLMDGYHEKKEDHPFLRETAMPQSIFDRYQASNLNREHFLILDQRMDGMEKAIAKMYTNNRTSYNYAFFFPQKHLLKNEIFNHINTNFSSKAVTNRTLIICDIPIYHTHLFLLGIENANFSDDFLDKFDTIILISEKLSHLQLKIDRKSKKFKRSEKVLSQAWFKPQFKPESYIIDIIGFLRAHDSFIFWLLLKSKAVDNETLFVKSNILWPSHFKKHTLNGYLNFTQVLTDYQLRNLFVLQLNRAKCLFHNSKDLKGKFEAVDILTEQLVVEANSQLDYGISLKNNSIKILIGSVYVTGTIESESFQSSRINPLITINFFLHEKKIVEQNQHNQLIDQNIYHFLLWPKDWVDNNFKTLEGSYSRLGRTHVIAPGGWKYFPIPRVFVYDNKEKRILKPHESSLLNEQIFNPFKELNNSKSNHNSDLSENHRYYFKNAYGLNPEDAYRSWQSYPNVIEFGHFEYEGKHDLLKIDFPLAVQNSFQEGSEMAVFIVAEFLIAIGADEYSITNLPESVSLISRSSKHIIEARLNQFRNNVRLYLSREKQRSTVNGILVYPSHYAAESIVNKVKSCIAQELHERIIPLVAINQVRNNSSYLVSPLILELLKSKIAKAHSKPNQIITVSIFDEATIDGKTRKDIKHLLFHAGADHVKSICLVDRRRLPLSPPNPKNHKAFWRMDVPRLGAKGECSFCQAISSVSNFKDNLIYTLHLERIDQWIAIWSSSHPFKKRKEHGILPIALKNSLKKDFCYFTKQSNNFEEPIFEIKLQNSLGLAIYISELHSMTGRLDLVIAMLHDDQIDSLSKIQVISFTLLLFGKEFSNRLALEAIGELVKLVSSEKAQSDFTSLGILTLLSLSDSQNTILIDHLEENIITAKNLDFELLIYQLASNHIKLEKKYKISGALKKSYIKDIRSSYFLFHQENYNDYGTPHNKAFTKIDDITEVTKIDKLLISEAIGSCDRLQVIIGGLPMGFSKNVTPENFKQEIIEQIIKIRSILRVHYTNINSINSNDFYNSHPKLYKDILKIKSQLKSLNKKVDILHDNYFIKMGFREENKFPIFDILSDLTLNFNKKPSFRTTAISEQFLKDPTEKEIERWVPMDTHIIQLINFILSNSQHATNKINKDFTKANISENNSTASFDMIASLEYLEHGIKLWFYNYSDRPLKDIIKDSKFKNHLQVAHLTDLGGETGITEKNHIENTYLIGTYIYLPYQ